MNNILKWRSAKPSKKAYAVVTGAGSGIGRSFALELVKRNGAVVCADINLDSAKETVALIEQQGGTAYAVKCDVAKASQVKKLAEQSEQLLGNPVTLVINNAGVATAGNVEDTSIEDWGWVLDIDLMGVVLGCHQFAGLMKRQKSGHIVNVSSFAGLAGLPFIAAYGVAKAGVVALSEALRAEMQPHGVGVTVACPAFFKTGLLDTFRATKPATMATVTRWMETSGISSEHVAQENAKHIAENTFLLPTHAHTRKAWRMKRWVP